MNDQRETKCACGRTVVVSQKKDNITELKKNFETAFDKYWYDNKSLSDKIKDSMDEEKEICRKFMEALNECGLLDECYALEELK